MMNGLETWPEIKARHKREKIQLIQCLSQNYTYSEASRILDWNTSGLVRFCHENRIKFVLSKKGGINEGSYTSGSRTF
jgi:hypothetical protein